MISSAVIEFRRGRSAINNSGGIFLGIQGRLLNEGDYFKGLHPGRR